MATEAILEIARESLNRVQQFDATSLSRDADLGKQMNFAAAVKPAEALINIYKRIPLTAIGDFSDTQLNSINGQAQADFNLFKQILDFDATGADASNMRTSILNSLSVRRDPLFDQVWQYIAYGVARTTDVSLLETQARSTIQATKDQSGKLTGQLNDAKTEADKTLIAIRAVASEQGVSPQAVHFKLEAEDQEKLAKAWLKYTYAFAIAVGLFAVFSLFFHKFELIRPTNIAEMFQLISSKFLIFAVLGYLLLMAARNYTTHKHNSVVNKHRRMLC